MEERGHLSLPSKDEQMQLRETKNLMSVGLLQLQVDEMLSEVHNEKYLVKQSPTIRSWIDSLAQSLKISTNLSSISPTWLQQQGITSLSFRDPEATISFTPPHEIRMIGSFPLNLITNPYLNVDIVVKLPQDILNQRSITFIVHVDAHQRHFELLLFR
jgi:hypothetical protein